jgi:hypothetical protein
MFELLHKLPPEFGGLIWFFVFLFALFGLTIVLKLTLAVVERRARTGRELTAEQRLRAIETMLGDIVERLERLEGRVERMDAARQEDLERTDPNLPASKD